MLYRRIEERFDRMLAAGALDEVRALLQRELPKALPAMKAIGVREIAAFLQDEIPLEEAAARAKTETRRYAKRQVTWFRHQMRDWQRIAERERRRLRRRVDRAFAERRGKAGRGPSAAPAGRRDSPAPDAQPSWARNASCSSVSTPSASTGICRLRPRPSTARTISAAWSRSPSWSTKLLSILSLSNGKACSVESEE